VISRLKATLGNEYHVVAIFELVYLAEHKKMNYLEREREIPMAGGQIKRMQNKKALNNKYDCKLQKNIALIHKSSSIQTLRIPGSQGLTCFVDE